jgi:hypothetical protein
MNKAALLSVAGALAGAIAMAQATGPIALADNEIVTRKMVT